VAKTTTEHTLFLASPGDTSADRAQLVPLVNEINGTYAPEDHRLRLLRWETDARPDGGRPQGVINDQIPDYDLFVALLWTRLGTPTGGYGSGTEEEIALALERRAASPSFPVFIYFCQRPFWPRSLDDIDQVRRLFEFRARLEREQQSLHWDYVTEVELRDMLRGHLCKRLQELARPARRLRAAASPDAGAIRDLRALWPSLDERAQAAFSIAYNENRAGGDPGIATEKLFAAFQRVAAGPDNPLGALLRQVSEDALPARIDGPVVARPYVATEQPWLSHCVASSIRRLLQHRPSDRQITGADIFADIAKHGTGSSVRRLREHGITAAHIDAMVARAGLEVVPT
jgi:hypothetical protein